MRTLSFISSFKRRAPMAALAAVLTVAAVEAALGLWGIYLEDRACLALRYKRAQLRNGRLRPDAVIIGSSQAMAIDARALELLNPGLSVWNGAVPNLESSWQYFLELKLLLDRAQPHRPRLAVLSVPYYCLLSEHYADFALSGKDVRHSRFTFMFDRAFVEKSVPGMTAAMRTRLGRLYARGIRGWFMSFRMLPNLSRMYKRGYFGGVQVLVRRRGPYDLASLSVNVKRERVSERIRDNAALLYRLRKSGGQMIFGPERKVDNGYLLKLLPEKGGVRRALDRNLAALGAMLSLARENGIRVVFFNMPVPAVFAEGLKAEGMLDALRSGLAGLERGYANFSVLEKASLLSWPREMFSDYAFHLNSGGAARFNEEFAAEIFPAVLADPGRD